MLEFDQLDFIAELVCSREDFVRLFDFTFDDVVGAADLKDFAQSGYLQRDVGCQLLGR